MPKQRFLLAFVLLLTSAVPVSAQDAPWPVRYRKDLGRIAQIEWRLRDAAGLSCPVSATDIGVVFDDRRAYPKPDWTLLAQVLGMGDRPVVAALAVGGPAAVAGLAVGDEIISIDGEGVEEIAARRNAGSLIGEALLDEIAAKPPGRPVTIAVHRNQSDHNVSIMPVRHCAARLVLVSDRSIDAHSDANNVAISTGLATFARNDDELALAAGHELAHIIHRDRRGAGMKRRRAMEDAADVLGLRLMRCAGFDGDNGLALFERLGARDWLGFLRAPTHRSFKARVERLRAGPLQSECPITIHHETSQ
ncbi:membrane-associated protease RseP (regulator of RpoE activity) [Novosphingobium hassiacum]|uniref:Membrane-associated protease RseP (Regulator of RpoE activity) n=1 Tax=Novosphingobium hassiacum TaxID=173676 RepID=A0A7W5ZY88_9SPHN|nr:M48 family metallopeptidase [Novosphingobium hassiacum]MBB3860407.1 membrane-associated protease RseP (regulator of RpoE activity) [Novosphingobium hassiacum]